ncbi:MAG: outer membrane beta-barrel protein [Hyphomonadaceae bacterium]
MRVALVACAALSVLAAAPAVAQTSDWSGWYVGGSIGQADVDSNDGETLVFDTNRDGVFNDTVNTTAPANAFSPGFCSGAANGTAPAAGCSSPGSEIGYALRAGYDWQYGNLVFGVVGEISKADIGDAVSGFSTTPASYTFKRDLDYAIAARLRGGYAFNNFLAYATGGYAQAKLDRTFSTTNGANSFTPSGDDTAKGYQVGAGVEYKVTPQWTVGVEYLQTSLDDDNYQVAVGPGTAPPTNPFLLVDPTGTDMRRSSDKFEYDTINVTTAWRF